MKATCLGCFLLVLGAGGALQAAASAQQRPDPVPRWEYRVLSKAQVADLGKQNLAAGLNKLGDEGWELVAVDAAYIFKRSRGPRLEAAAAARQVALAEADVEACRDRVAWSERMARKGYLSEQQVRAAQMQLQRAELALDRARRELPPPPADPNKAVEKEPAPAK